MISTVNKVNFLKTRIKRVDFVAQLKLAFDHTEDSTLKRPALNGTRYGEEIMKRPAAVFQIALALGR